MFLFIYLFLLVLITSLSEIAMGALWEYVLTARVLRLCFANSVAKVTPANQSTPQPVDQLFELRSTGMQYTGIHFPFLIMCFFFAA